MSRTLRRLMLSSLAGAGLLAAPLANPPAPLALLGLGSTAAHAQWQGAACRMVLVAGQWVYRCARAAAPHVYRVWSHPRTQGTLWGLGVGVPSFLAGNRPRPAHAPGYHAPGAHGRWYSGPRYSPYQENWLRYHAYRQQQLGHRHGPVQQPPSHWPPQHSMGAYRGSYRASGGHHGGGALYDPPR